MHSQESSVKKFNSTVQKCLEDFKGIFGETDPDIQCIQGAFALTKINARLFIGPFQKYISNNPLFVKNIMEMNTEYFISYDFKSLLNKANVLDEYTSKLINKFRDATISHKDDKKTTDAIFNWFKVLMYYAFEDENRNPVEEMNKMVKSNAVTTN
jgi:hypothetical protein